MFTIRHDKKIEFAFRKDENISFFLHRDMKGFIYAEYKDMAFHMAFPLLALNVV